MKNDRIIALDIGTDGIRMAVAVSGSSEVLDSGYAAFDSDAPAGLPREAIVAMTLKRLLEGKRPGTNRAAISIEGQSVFSRLVKLPMVGSDEVEKTIRHEAVQNIPFPIEEVVWDAHVIDPESTEPEVLLVAVKSDLVEGLVHAVTANGLSVERITVAPVALANALHALFPMPGPALLVDAGEQAANLVFVDGARVFFRTLPVSGNDPERLVQEIERSITFYRSQQQGRSPERIWIGGESADLSVLKERLPVPAELFSSGVCSGLVINPVIEINLVPASLGRELEIKRRQPFWLAAAVLLMLLLAVWIFNLDLQVQRAAATSVYVEEQVAELGSVESRLLPLEDQVGALMRRAVVYETAMTQRSFWLETLSEISRLLPDGMFLLASEPIRPMGKLTGTRISVVSYLDKEPPGQDAVKLLRDTLRASERFSAQTKVFSRPSKKMFAREFVLDVYFAEVEE